MARPAREVAARFWAKVQRGEGCWLWTANRTRLGYGLFWSGEKMVSAHRMAWRLAVGPIPAGLTLDHLCRNRACVNPAHLEPVTHAENVARGARAQAARCVHGHPFDEANTYTPPGTRRRCCRECTRERQARWGARRAGRIAAPTVPLDRGPQRKAPRR